jgi:hypothetical protein
MAANPTLRLKIEELGRSLLAVAEDQINGWIDGTWIVPPEPFADVGGIINHWIINMKPLHLDLDDEILKSFQTGELTAVYNEIITEHNSNRCQSSAPPEVCRRLNESLLGLMIAFRRNEMALVSDIGLPPNKMKNAAQKLLSYTLPFSNANIISQLVRYEDSGTQAALHEIVWSATYKNSIYDINKDYSLIETKLPTDDQRQKGLIINHLRWNVALVDRILDGQTPHEDMSQPLKIAVSRIESLRSIAPKILSRQEQVDSKDHLLPQELYSSLGILNKYYERNSEIPKMNSILIQRGWLRAFYRELTPSCAERFFLKAWGLVTRFGTNISISTILMMLLLVPAILFVICNLDPGQLSISTIVDETMRIITLKANGDFRPQSVAILLELMFLVTVPLYFGYLVTFLLSWK